jgi:hypothetical protein
LTIDDATSRISRRRAIRRCLPSRSPGSIVMRN